MAQKSPVAAIADLRALLFHDDDDLIFVSGTGGRYRYEASSANADDGNASVRPTNFDTTGVWLKVAADPEKAGAGVTKTTIIEAEVRALNGTPIEVVAAPGANKAVIFEGATLFKAAGVAYAGIAAGEDFVLRYTDGSGLILGRAELTGFADQVTAQTRYIKALRGTQSAVVADPATPMGGSYDQGEQTAQSDSIIEIKDRLNEVLDTIVPVANAALMAHILVGEIITGDSDFIVEVRYRVIDTVLT